MPHSAASDLGLHCLAMSLLWDAKLKRVKVPDRAAVDDILKYMYFFYGWQI